MPTNNNATPNDQPADANAGGCAITLNINGQDHAFTVEPRLTLRDARPLQHNGLKIEMAKRAITRALVTLGELP